MPHLLGLTHVGVAHLTIGPPPSAPRPLQEKVQIKPTNHLLSIKRFMETIDIMASVANALPRLGLEIGGEFL